MRTLLSSLLVTIIDDDVFTLYISQISEPLLESPDLVTAVLGEFPDT